MNKKKTQSVKQTKWKTAIPDETMVRHLIIPGSEVNLWAITLFMV
jgi:hypothetical protein